jgi:hypothetical protein
MKIIGLPELLCGRTGATVENRESVRFAGGCTPPVFCKRVRNSLIIKELLKYSFLRSAQEFENKEFSF